MRLWYLCVYTMAGVRSALICFFATQIESSIRSGNAIFEWKNSGVADLALRPQATTDGGFFVNDVVHIENVHSTLARQLALAERSILVAAIAKPS